MSDFNPTTILDTPVTDITGVDEVQKIIFTKVTGGTFTIDFDGDVTEDIAFNATPGAVEDALGALNNLDPSEISVSGEAGKNYVLAFEGAWADQDVPQVAVDSSALTGAEKEVKVETTTAGSGNAVIRGTGNADRTGDVSPLTGESPSARRTAHGTEFGD